MKKYKVRECPEQQDLKLTITQKWTGSRILVERFNSDILGDPKSFTRRDLTPLLNEYTDLLTTLRAASSDVSEVSTPRISSRRASSTLVQAQLLPQSYWNEYDNGSEAGDEPYIIYCNPDDDSTFPGAKAISFVLSKAKGPVESVKRWFTPMSSPENPERQALLQNSSMSGYFPDADTEADDEAYASSTDFPSGYSTHYATFPSVSEQKLSQYRERLLFHATLGSFAASLILLMIAGILVATGKHRLRIEVDAGVIVGVVSSLFFATLGFGMMLYRKDTIGWLHQVCVGITFAVVCVFNGVLLVVVVGNSGL